MSGFDVLHTVQRLLSEHFREKNTKTWSTAYPVTRIPFWWTLPAFCPHFSSRHLCHHSVTPVPSQRQHRSVHRGRAPRDNIRPLSRHSERSSHLGLGRCPEWTPTGRTPEGLQGTAFELLGEIVVMPQKWSKMVSNTM